MADLADVQKQLLADIAAQIRPEIDAAVKKLKRSDDVEAVRLIATQIATETYNLAVGHGDRRDQLLTLEHLRNALSAYKGVGALQAYNLTTRIVGITIGLVAKAALTAVIL